MNAFKWLLPIVCAAVCSSCIFGANNQKRSTNNEWYQRKLTHRGKDLTSNELKQLVSMGNETHFREMLKPILIERVADTKGSYDVRKHIVNHMRSVGWTVQEHSFTDATPLGQKTFTNVLATLDPSTTRRLILACHYDSKLYKETFIGATDSAVPCAMLLNLATVMKKQLDEYTAKKPDVTLQFVFFDGEEAFVNWNENDSLYGARALAQELHRSEFPIGNKKGISELHRMDLFVLLDLIGTRDCSFHSLYENSDRWFVEIAKYEANLRSSGLLNKREPLFRGAKLYGARIEDDHVPFLRKGVPILHLISVPFPSVWHKPGDNEKALHYPTIEDMNTLTRVFVAHYLGLNL